MEAEAGGREAEARGRMQRLAAEAGGRGWMLEAGGWRLEAGGGGWRRTLEAERQRLEAETQRLEAEAGCSVTLGTFNWFKLVCSTISRRQQHAFVFWCVTLLRGALGYFQGYTM